MSVPTGAGNYPAGVTDNDPYFDMPSVGDDEEPEPEHVHSYRLVPARERNDHMKYVCSMFKCECGRWYWL